MVIYYPRILNIFLTRRCNLKCPHCFVNKDTPKGEEIDISSLKKAIDIFLKFPGNCKVVNFGGGEPLLRFGKIKTICQYLQWIKKENIKIEISITTNGTLLDENRYRFLRENRINLKVSIDGRKEINDFQRPFKSKRYGSTYERIKDNLDRFYFCSKNGHKIRAQLVFTPSTVKSLFSNIEFLWKEGFDDIDFMPEIYAQWSQDELNILEGEVKKIVNFYISLFENGKEKRIFRNTLLRNLIEGKDLYKSLSCQEIHLDWKGNFYCCDKVFSLPESERKQFTVGNVHRGIDNHLRLKLLEGIRKQIKYLIDKNCAYCRYLKYCFCPLGQYIYFSSQGLDFERYFFQICRIAKIFIGNFLEIKKNLNTNSLFNCLYR